MKDRLRESRMKVNSQKILTVIVALSLLWVFGQMQVFGQQKEVQPQWTVETHDNTNFPLVGKHRTTSCADCHLNLVFEGTPRECEACHWERRQDDRYQLRLGTHCGDCHTPYTWKNVSPNKWNHTAATGFRLEGQHRMLDCIECHGEAGFDKVSVACLDCHEEDYEEARNPDHGAAGFSTQCQLCHINQNSWGSAVFSHDRFILRGEHKSADCSDCHSSGQYAGLSTDCVSCHREDYNEADDPDHQALNFPTDCVACHGSSATTWEGASYSHTVFPLLGQHKTAECSECHPDGNYAATSSACVSCHRDDYNDAEDPDHQALNFPTDCVACHGSSATTWEGASYSHTVFLLLGQHKTAQCSDCHPDGNYAGTSSTCVSCHRDDYDSADDPDHQALNFPTDCVSCHGSSATTWEGASYTHASFQLAGQHLAAQCSDCHPDGNYAGTSTACVSCHLDDYNSTTDPDHQALSFSTACETCHGTSYISWQTVTFDHSEYWPLQGAHTSLSCSSCHDQGYNLPHDCYGCHATDYENTTDPGHAIAGFPTDCVICHFPSHLYWTQAVFDHQFPIASGKHSNAECSDCHITSNYKEFSCITCHTHNETRMSNEHGGVAGYVYESLACYSCHPQGTD